MSSEDRTTVGLTAATLERLRRLDTDQVFAEMRDGYKFGIAYAVSNGSIAPEGLSYETYIGTASLDPDGSLKAVIEELYPGQPPYSTAQRLAEWGVSEIGRMHENGTLRFADILPELRSAEA